MQTHHHAVIILLPSNCKDVFDQEIKQNSLETNECILRIGIEAIKNLHLIQQEDGIQTEIIKTYESKLSDKEKEKTIFEKLVLENQENIVNQRVTHLLEQSKYNQEEVNS